MTEQPNNSKSIALPIITLLTLVALAAVTFFGCDTAGLIPNPKKSRLDVGDEVREVKKGTKSTNAKSSKGNVADQGQAGKLRSGTTLPRRGNTTLPNRSGTTLPRRSGTTLPNRSGYTLPNRGGTTLPNRSGYTLPKRGMRNRSGTTLPN